jgi:hypothetical protein
MIRYVLFLDSPRGNSTNYILQMCDLRKKAHLQKSYTPSGSPETIAKNVYYLESVDDMFRRKYLVKA